MKSLEKMMDLIKSSIRTVVLTGAGISTESGLPDFRSDNGFWSKNQPIQFKDFLRDQGQQRLSWSRNIELHKLLEKITPNSGHELVRNIISLNRNNILITQNIDGLHQESGITEDQIIEIHGNATKAACLDCFQVNAIETFHDAIVSNIDLAPTFLHLATGSTKDFPPMDGSSLIDEIVRQEKEERTIFSELNKDRAAISTQWKYIRLGLEMYAGGDKNCQDPGIGRQASSYPGKSDTKQLYDLSKDGGEQDNVAKDTSTSNKMNGMLECHLKRTSIGSTDYETNCDDATPLISESQGVIGRETTWFVATVSFVAALWCVVA